MRTNNITSAYTPQQLANGGGGAPSLTSDGRIPAGGGGFGRSPAFETSSQGRYNFGLGLPEITDELAAEYRNTGRAFSSSDYNVASRDQQSRVLTTATNSANAAAADYSNRARQAGGSGMGAGLIKAQAVTGARATAGAMELDRAKYETEQRERAAGHAAGIARDLGKLRTDYLSTLTAAATARMNSELGFARLAEEQFQFDYTDARSRADKQFFTATVGGPGSQFHTMADYNAYVERNRVKAPTRTGGPGASFYGGGR